VIRDSRPDTIPMSEQDTPAGRYYIETWGCQMNVHDSEKLAGALERQGYTAAPRVEQADVVLLNTCSIREKAAEKVFGELGRLRTLKTSNPGMLLGVCGCVAQQEGEAIYRRAPYVDFVIGPRATGSLPEIVGRLRRGDRTARHSTDTEYRRDSIEYPFDAIRREGIGTRKAFVTVIEGCNHRCTYCIVPTTRGREVCRPLPEVLSEVRALAEQGVLEIEFLGQTVNAYRDADGNTLGELLLAAARVDGVERLRFTTSHPAQMTERLMDAMAEASPVVCPYLHLPAQSGSSPMLKAMRRGYTREGYLAKIEALRDRIPGMRFGTDIIVGFPGETDEDFEQTLSLLDAVEYDTCYSFAYSPRPGTAALDLTGEVPLGEKLERLNRLQAHQKIIQARRNDEWVGRSVEVLVEGPSRRDSAEWTGRTPENRVVNFAGSSSAGRLERLTITRASAYSLRGEQTVPLQRLTGPRAPVYKTGATGARSN
jgi:tRNA-2-methylthio-N6-dimethylallyladenosine synthase